MFSWSLLSPTVWSLCFTIFFPLPHRPCSRCPCSGIHGFIIQASVFSEIQWKEFHSIYFDLNGSPSCLFTQPPFPQQISQMCLQPGWKSSAPADHLLPFKESPSEFSSRSLLPWHSIRSCWALHYYCYKWTFRIWLRPWRAGYSAQRNDPCS